MAAFRCNACQATYRDVAADGSLYFHACAPIPNPAFQPNAAKPLPDFRETVERPNKRDENLTRASLATSTPVIVAAGAGRTQIGP